MATPEPEPNPSPIPEPPPQKNWYVSTFAGDGEKEMADGDALGASFYYPWAIKFTASGELFTSEQFSIRKISNGKVVTYFGKRIADPSNLYFHIYGIGISKAGLLYNIESNMIRRVVSPDSSYVLAGSNLVSYADGQGTNASFTNIWKMAFDLDDNLILPDFDLNIERVIRKITPQGFVTTLPLNDKTGITSGSTPSRRYLSAVAVDASGNTYYVCGKGVVIKKRDATGNVSVFAGSILGHVDGKGDSAQFAQILDMGFDNSGNLFVLDGLTNTLRKVTPDGLVTTLAGLAGPGYYDGRADSARFLNPTALTVDKAGNIYIADGGNNRIRKMEYR